MSASKKDAKGLEKDAYPPPGDDDISVFLIKFVSQASRIWKIQISFFPPLY